MSPIVAVFARFLTRQARIAARCCILIALLASCSPQPPAHALQDTPLQTQILPTSTPTPASAPTVLPASTEEPFVLPEVRSPLLPGAAEPAGSAGAVARAEQALLAELREQSGARALLGTDADEMFGEIDAARSAAIGELLTSGTSGKSSGHALIRPIGIPGQLVAAGNIWGAAGALLLGAPAMFGGITAASGQAGAYPTLDRRLTTDRGGQIKVKLQPRVQGGWVLADAEVTARAARAGVTVEETGTGSIRAQICPDANGEVVLDLTIDMAIAAAQGGQKVGRQATFKIRAVGHVDDEANLSTIRVDTKAGLGEQQAPGAGAYLEWRESFTIGLGEPRNAGQREVSLADYRGDYTRASSNASGRLGNKTREAIFDFGWKAALLTLESMEQVWQGGRCVEIVVPEQADSDADIYVDLNGGGRQFYEGAILVDPGEDAPFTAIARHKIEGTELQAPVVATLAHGREAVTPSGTKIASPARFTFTAPERLGETALVELESRSRRGVGTKAVPFKVAYTTVVLEVDSTESGQMIYGGLVFDRTIHVRAIVPLKRAHEKKTYEGSGPVETLSHEARLRSQSACKVTFGPPSGGRVDVQRIRIGDIQDGLAMDIEMDAGSTDEPQVPIVLACPKMAELKSAAGSWSLNSIMAPMPLRDWRYLPDGGDRFAQARIKGSRVMGMVKMTEDTTLTLKYVPKKK